MGRMSASFNELMYKQKTMDTSWFSNIGNEQKTIHYLCVRFTVCLIIGFGWNSARSLRYIKIWYICMRCHFNLPCFDFATMMFLLNHTELYRHGNLYNNNWRNRKIWFIWMFLQLWKSYTTKFTFDVLYISIIQDENGLDFCVILLIGLVNLL